jgi:hypothetical protein
LNRFNTYLDKFIRLYKSLNIQVQDRLSVSILVLSVVISAVILSGNIYTSSVEAEPVDRYWGVLQVYGHSRHNSDASGFVGLKFREDFKQLVYSVNVNNIDNITGVYFYNRGDDTKNSTRILNLLHEAKEVKVKDKFKEANVLLNKKHEIEGTVAVGGVTSSDLGGVLKGRSLEDLHRLVTSGKSYVLVTTKQFPHGEIRGGDFVPIDRIFPDTTDFKWD